jgi:hypothetical protein
VYAVGTRGVNSWAYETEALLWSVIDLFRRLNRRREVFLACGAPDLASNGDEIHL